jgi:hypothetical protein
MSDEPVQTAVEDKHETSHQPGSRSRRALLTAGAGAIGALVAQGVARPVPAAAVTYVRLGQTNSATSATGISSTSGNATAVAFRGQMNAPTPGANSAGVAGFNKGSSTTSSGVRGKHNGAGRGVTGLSAGGTGVFGDTDSVSGYGVHGTSPNSIASALNAVGVRGEGTVGVMGSGAYMGVQGNSPGYAVFGYTTPDTGGTGVYGRGADGVRGRSFAGRATVGETDTGVGVYGTAFSGGGATKAVWGKALGSNSNGVVGEASVGTSAYGIWGISTTGYAGVFSGKVLVTGNLSKGGGSFRIDHPLDPQNKYLSHSFVESPDMLNIYNGNVTTGTNGRAVIRLPRYFSALNRDFRYQLTVIGAMAQAIVEREIEGGRFTIRTSQPRVKVSWQVTGIRQDPYANQNRIKVEQAKPRSERGSYLHPKAYGKPVSAGIQGKKLAGLRTPRRNRRDQELRRPA